MAVAPADVLGGMAVITWHLVEDSPFQSHHRCSRVALMRISQTTLQLGRIDSRLKLKLPLATDGPG